MTSPLRTIAHDIIFVFIIVSSQIIAAFDMASTIFPVGNYGQITWLSLSFLMGMGPFLLIAGQVGDIFGLKTVYLSCLLLHSFANVGIGFATNIYELTILRGIAGMFLGLAQPSGLAMIPHAFPIGMKRNLSYTAFAISFMVGWVLGCYNTGFWDTYYDWEWVFWVIAIAAFVITIAGIFVIPKEINIRNGSFSNLDFLGIMVGLAALLLITFGISHGAAVGWAQPLVYAPFTVGVILWFLFIFVESKVKNPVMPLAMWKNSVVAVVIVCLSFTFFAYGIFFLFGSMLLSIRESYILEQGTLWIPGAITAIILALCIPLALRFLGFHIIFPISTGCLAVSHLLLAFSPEQQSYWSQAFVAIILAMPSSVWLPMGCALVLLSSVDPDHEGMASSLLNVAIILPISWGFSCSTILQLRIMEHGGSLIEGIHGAAWLGFSFASVAFLVSLFGRKKLLEANVRFNTPVTENVYATIEDESKKV